ncbi:MAG: hypothetical protein ACRDZ2_00060 [Ilumatobacteraceae bacterium]
MSYGIVYGEYGQACVFDFQWGYYGGAYLNFKMRNGYQCREAVGRVHTPGSLPAGNFAGGTAENVWYSSGSPGNPFAYGSFRIQLDNYEVLCVDIYSNGRVGWDEYSDGECYV